MKQNQEAVLGWIGLSEGGYVNHPKDPGGATDRGITQRTYDAWNRRADGWVSVDEPPKEKTDDILVCIYTDGYKRWFDGVYDGKQFFIINYKTMEPIKPTHWMYVPIPPEEEK